MLNKIRKNLKDKAGFTLVELIVVLVILAILAAMLVPALTGYIDKANKEKVTAECRQVVMAAQTEASTLYGKVDGGKIISIPDPDGLGKKIEDLSETNGKFAITITAGGIVKNVKYQNSNWEVEYNNKSAFPDGSTVVDGYSDPKKIAAESLTNSVTLASDSTNSNPSSPSNE